VKYSNSNSSSGWSDKD